MSILTAALIYISPAQQVPTNTAIPEEQALKDGFHTPTCGRIHVKSRSAIEAGADLLTERRLVRQIGSMLRARSAAPNINQSVVQAMERAPPCVVATHSICMVRLRLMFFWFSGAMLALEAAKVIESRLRMITWGECTTDELFLMVTEKLDALGEAHTIILRGGHPKLIVENYRRIVAANAARLDHSE